MILSLSEVAQFKEAVADKFSVNIHFCDSCGGQSFKIDYPTEELKSYIISYFIAKNLKAIFTETGESFTLKEC